MKAAALAGDRCPSDSPGGRRSRPFGSCPGVEPDRSCSVMQDAHDESDPSVTSRSPSGLRATAAGRSPTGIAPVTAIGAAASAPDGRRSNTCARPSLRATATRRPDAVTDSETIGASLTDADGPSGRPSGSQRRSAPARSAVMTVPSAAVATCVRPNVASANGTASAGAPRRSHTATEPSSLEVIMRRADSAIDMRTPAGWPRSSGRTGRNVSVSRTGRRRPRPRSPGPGPRRATGGDRSRRRGRRSVG